MSDGTGAEAKEKSRDKNQGRNLVPLFKNAESSVSDDRISSRDSSTSRDKNTSKDSITSRDKTTSKDSGTSRDRISSKEKDSSTSRDKNSSKDSSTSRDKNPGRNLVPLFKNAESSVSDDMSRDKIPDTSGDKNPGRDMVPLFKENETTCIETHVTSRSRPPKATGQRYYLYDKELKRPAEAPPAPPPYQPRPRQRLPFHRHDYFGIYPTADDERFEQKLRERRQREYLIYSRPPDVYHGAPAAAVNGYKSERSDGYHSRSDRYSERSDRHRGDYDSGSSSERHRHRHGHSSSHSYYRDRYDRYDDQDRYDDGRHSSRDYYSSSTRRRRRSDEPGSRSRSSEKVKGHVEEKGPDEFDLNVEIHPLMHFIDDKPKLLKEALAILRGRKLDAMIPPMFADLNARELEQSCLQELNTLNIATIANVIDGKLVNSELTNPIKTKTKLSKISKLSKKPGVSVTKIKKKLKETLTEEPPKKKKKRKEVNDPPKKVKKKHKKKKKRVKGSKSDEEPAGPGLPPQKTLMELLELEYRAKAIKALLKSQDIDVDSSSKIDQALLVDPGDIVDPNRPIVDDPRPLAPPPPPVSTRFLVDNQYIYPMQIKLELEEPPPEIVIDEATFPPSPEMTPGVREGHEGVKGQSPVVETADSRKVSLVITLDSDDDSEGDAPEAHCSSAHAAHDSLSAHDSVSAQERAKLMELCSNEPYPYDLDLVKTEVVETEAVSESDLEDGEYDDDVEIASDPEPDSVLDRETEATQADTAPETQPMTNQVELEDIGSEDEDDVGPQTYVRQRADIPAETPLDKNPAQDLSPPRIKKPFRPEPAITFRPISTNFRPEPTTFSRLSADDISSAESDLEGEDDGIIIGGFDPSADPDDETLPPIHGCAPRPEGYEAHDSEEEEAHESEEDEAPEEEEDAPRAHEEEDEDTNPRTWFNRWYNSKKVQKNVKSNKMIGKLRSKLRREKAIIEPPAPEPSEEAVPIIGSISEYQTLFSSGKFKAVEPEIEEEEDKEEKVSEEDVAEEDDEALWGDIIG